MREHTDKSSPVFEITSVEHHEIAGLVRESTQARRFPDRSPEQDWLRGDQLKGDKVILVVDDDQMVLRFICSVLCLRGYTRLLAAEDAAQAMELASRYPGRIDLLLSDVVLAPGVNGGELAKRITCRRPDTRVLLMSGYDGQDLQLESGWQFIHKPFVASELIQCVESTLPVAA